MNEEKTDGKCLPCKDAQTQDWYAWINLMPPPPDDFHVVGEVYVPNPGVDPFLTPRVPQGTNPTILQLDLYLCQQPGIWPQVFVWKPVRYDKVGRNFGYERVEVFCGEERIADFPVETVH